MKALHPIVNTRGITASRGPRVHEYSRFARRVRATFVLHSRLVLTAVVICTGVHAVSMATLRKSAGARRLIIQRYLGKISGPLLDRIDLHIEVPAVAYKEMRGNGEGVTSEEMRERVLRARERQQARGYYNAHLPPRLLRKLTELDDSGERTLEMAVRRMGLSARAHHRILKVSRTIADLGSSDCVSAKHVAEAVQYRSLDRNYWS